MSKRSGVYKFTNKINGKVYIGSTNDISKRYYVHIKGTKGSPILYNAINKYGLESFTFELIISINIKSFDSELEFFKELRDQEQLILNFYYAQEYIKSEGKDRRFRNLTYNICPTVGTLKGHKWTEEQKEKAKERIRKFGHTSTGTKRTPESIERARQGKRINRKSFIAIKNNEIFGPFKLLSDCSRELGIDDTYISRCLNPNHEYEKAKGFTFKYLENTK